ncbi:hypothetical protein BJ170DRAFT_232852 [Xylariales sp. AK1849]|nr:hypothetical protein BJ170DRAFT_232852 [Xylariales sp. AK1849]
MTTRNLNKTWRDVVFAQYAADHEADVPFPVRYLIHVRTWGRDIFINIPQKIDVRTLRQAVLEFYAATRSGEPLWEGEHISVQPRGLTRAVVGHEGVGTEQPAEEARETGLT